MWDEGSYNLNLCPLAVQKGLNKFEQVSLMMSKLKY